MPNDLSDPLLIIYQDDDLVAINKPSGLLVHRSPIDKHETRFAVQQLRNQLGQHVYPLHRLDKPTSGCVGVCPVYGRRPVFMASSFKGTKSKNLLGLGAGLWP